MWLFVAIIGVPLIEIALFVTVGGALGLWPTLAIVLGTGVLGVVVLRRQSVKMRGGMQGALRAGVNPLSPMAHGVLITFAAMLLILPGFMTDTLGLLLLIPPVRSGIIALLASRVTMRGFGTSSGARRDADVIDGEFYEAETPPPPRVDGPSGWTRH